MIVFQRYNLSLLSHLSVVINIPGITRQRGTRNEERRTKNDNEKHEARTRAQVTFSTLTFLFLSLLADVKSQRFSFFNINRERERGARACVWDFPPLISFPSPSLNLNPNTNPNLKWIDQARVRVYVH